MSDTGEKRIFRIPWRAVFVLLIIGIMAGIVVMGTRSRGTNHPRQVILTDGTRVELLGTGVGAPFTTDNKWQQMARQYLPRRFQKWLPAVTSCRCGSGLAVYLNVTTPTGTPVTSLSWNTIMIEDESGFCYPSEGGHCSFGGLGSPKVYGFNISTYPRREREFLFHMLDSKGFTLGTLRVPNPVPGTFPAWKPLPLPQTLSNGPVTLTLQGLEEHGDARWRYINPKWRVESNDPAWARAQARGLTLSDATGNDSYQVLSPREPAWKLQTRIYRSRLEDFTPDEQLTITNLAVPAAGNFIPADQAGECAGVKIKLLAVAGSGSLNIDNGVPRSMSTTPFSGYSCSDDGRNRRETWGWSTPFLAFEARDMQDGDQLDFYVRDEQGRELKVNSNSSGRRAGARAYSAGFTVPEGTKAVSVQIVVNRSLPFEFMVNPKDVVRKK